MSRNISVNRETKLQDRIERGKRIKQIRIELKMTQVDVSIEFGLSKGMVSEYENGKYEPPANLILGLSRKSGRNIAWIMTGEGPEYDEALKSPSLKVKDKEITKYSQPDKLNQVIEYLRNHPDLLESVWQLIQGREGLKKFEKGE
ncbi:MAG: helix-turn-helix domain-containing protein [bacterium]